MPLVRVPRMLQHLTEGKSQVEAEGSCLREIVASLERSFPGLGKELCDGERIRPSVTFTVDGKLATRGLDTPVADSSVVDILPSFGGG